VPFSLRSRWSERETTYSGRFLVKSAEIASVSLRPALGYKLADRLSVGAGLELRLLHYDHDKNIPLFNPFTQRVQDVAALAYASGQRFSLGFNVGLLAKPSDGLALGASYRHGARAELSGNADIALIPTGSSQFDALLAQRLPQGAVAASSEVALPAVLSLAAQYSWGEWLLAVQVDLQRWSSFEALPLTLEGWPQLSVEGRQDFTSSQVYRIGLERRISDTLSLRGGYFLDRTPVPAPSLGPMFPDATRHCAALGATWRRGRLRIDAGNGLVFGKERGSEGLSRDGYDGSYKSFTEIFSVTLGWSF
jgi:long-chain fatty acid transport protein